MSNNRELLNPEPDDTTALADFVGNISHCWRCSHCKWVPSPQSYRFANACPSIEWGGFHAYSGGGKMITAHALKEGEADYSETALESIFACTMCGACDTSCKNNNGELVEPLTVMYALRQHVADEGHALPAHRATLANLRSTGNPYGKPRENRTLWAQGLDVPDLSIKPAAVLLHIGCENAYDEKAWAELRAIVALLQKAGVDFATLGAAESATGEGAFDLGFADAAKEQAGAMAAKIARPGVSTVVTCSASSFAGMRNIWPRLGITPPPTTLVHITEFIDQLLENGRLVATERLDAAVTYHDPCKLGRLSEPFTPGSRRWKKDLNVLPVSDGPRQVLMGNEGLYDAPRRLLQRIPGLKLVEMERNRHAAYCCGAGGGAKSAYREFAQFAARERLAEAGHTEAEILATSCAGCQGHLAEVRDLDGGAQSVSGVFGLIAASVLGGLDGVA
ncbi:(Fe-S)-binding protein [Sphingobium lactosutens]|uniref:(Fe-S)-binding protein n=1 Tax=Sphingobium lactosutens DS20 TaxID=1331060 RepID=T0HMM5_9SPHN|nr:heterodisulfide reductase-related iron-sulfur binding cluster [Sphingobium lactosutens]EQB13428.1 hypothetical protein RLDS_16990 [Sphingobium lactosutens DS20]